MRHRSEQTSVQLNSLWFLSPTGRGSSPGHGVSNWGRGRKQQTRPESWLEVCQGQLGGALQPLPGRLPHITANQGLKKHTESQINLFSSTFNTDAWWINRDHLGSDVFIYLDMSSVCFCLLTCFLFTCVCSSQLMDLLLTKWLLKWRWELRRSTASCFCSFLSCFWKRGCFISGSCL